MVFAGFDALQIDASIEAVLSLARATGTKLPTAANIAAGALRSFNLEADQMRAVEAEVMGEIGTLAGCVM